MTEPDARERLPAALVAKLVEARIAETDAAALSSNDGP